MNFAFNDYWEKLPLVTGRMCLTEENKDTNQSISHFHFDFTLVPSLDCKQLLIENQICSSKINLCSSIT